MSRGKRTSTLKPNSRMAQPRVLKNLHGLDLVERVEKVSDHKFDLHDPLQHAKAVAAIEKDIRASHYMLDLYAKHEQEMTKLAKQWASDLKKYEEGLQAAIEVFEKSSKRKIAKKFMSPKHHFALGHYPAYIKKAKQGYAETSQAASDAKKYCNESLESARVCEELLAEVKALVK